MPNSAANPAAARQKLLTKITAVQKQADSAKKAAKQAKAGCKVAKEKFKAAKRSAKKFRKELKALKAELAALAAKKQPVRKAVKSSAKRAKPAVPAPVAADLRAEPTATEGAPAAPVVAPAQ